MRKKDADGCATLIVAMIIIGGFGAFIKAALPIILILIIVGIIIGIAVYTNDLEKKQYATGMDYIAEYDDDSGKHLISEKHISGNGKYQISVSDMKSKATNQLQNYGYKNIKVYTIDEYSDYKIQLNRIKQQQEKKEQRILDLFNSTCVNCGASDFERIYDGVQCSYCKTIYK